MNNTNKVWNETRLFTEEQIVTVLPNETHTGLVMVLNETQDNTSEYRLYLNYEETKMLISQLDYFLKQNCNNP